MDKRDTLSVLRIDFGATIRDNEGHEKLILNPKNMRHVDAALPMPTCATR